jgi:hypothetical protein
MVPKIEQCKHMTNIVPKGYTNEGEKYDHTVQNVSEQANLLTDIVAKIRSSTLEGEMLNTAVQCIRQGTGCDRAVIYSLQSGQHGTIIAESVAPVYPKTIGMKIVDPCFDRGYAIQYQKQIHSMVSIDTQANTTTTELESISSEIRSLIRLLQQEATKSPDLAAAEPEQRNLLPIIAKRLQRHMEEWDNALARLAPQQRQISELLGDTLHSIESNRIPSK